VELVTMPQLGETVTEGTIIRWHKQVGDQVAVDDVLFEVSTEKVDTEVPSAHAGVLRVVHVPEGETVPVGALLAVITETADEPFEDARAATPARASAPAPADQASPAPTGASAPAAEGPAMATTAPARAPRPSDDHNGFLSPVVRALLEEHGLRPDDVVGTGTGGRITRNDVLAAAANARRADSPASPAAASAVPTAPSPTPTTTPVPRPGPDDDVVEFTKARRATADHMVRSLATSAHTLVAAEVDYHRVDPVRRRAGLSFLPFVARATIDALGEFDHLNASVGDDQLIVHRRIHLGVAVDVHFEALVVPVVHDAGDMRLVALAEAISTQAEKARTKRLTGEDLSGGTFTITNVGTYGTVVTAPVINQPQVAILSTDGVRMRPTAVRSAAGEWTVAVHPLGNLSLSFDHRAVDGAYAAAFLARVRELLETRDWTQELG
jgi:pyruvate dehydrogenase E2 component (dihydrolipoamide acetyltransferase)